MAADPKKIKEISDLLDQIQKQYNKLGEKNPFKGIDPNKVKDIDKEIKRLEASLDGVESKARRLNTSFDDLSKTLKAIVNEFNPNALNATKLLEKGMKGLVSEANKLANEEEDIGSLSKKNLEKILERAKASQKMAKDNAAAILQEMGIRTKDGKVQEKDGLKIGRMKAEDRAKAIAALGIYKDENNIQKDLLEKIKNRIGLEDKFNKKIGFGGQLAKGLDKALQKAGLPSLGIADAMDEARKNFVKTNGQSSVFKDTLKGIGKNLGKALSTANLLQGAFTLLVKAVMDVDKATGEFAKNQGISYQEALKLRGEMNEIAKSSGDVMVNSAELMKTQASLNKYFDSSVKFSGKLAADMTSIARRTNMSEESQGVFALEAMKTGKGAKGILKTQTLQVLEMNKQKGLTLSVKQTQEAIGKTSKALQLTFKGSTKELTKQVMSAKALGANLNTVEGIASSLLDFESSIQAELQAELILGKEINLEKARQAALEGDMGKVAEEVMKNKAIMNAFETKNVIAQEAAAKSLGMSRNDLAEMVHEQEKMAILQKGLGKDVTNMSDAQKAYNDLRAGGMSAEEAAAQLGDDTLATQLESVSAQEKLAGVMERIRELFVSLAEPILAIVTPIIDLLVPALQSIAFILAPIFDTFEGIAGILTGNIESLGTMEIIMGSIGLLALGYLATTKTIALYEYIIATRKANQNLMSIASLYLEQSKKKGIFSTIGALTLQLGIQLGLLSASLATNAAVTFGVGVAIAVAAALAGYAAIKAMTTSVGDVMSPADGKTQISTKEGGLFELSPNDDLIAAPGAADMMTKKGEKDERGGGARRDAALIAKVEQLIAVNQQILAKSPIIEMSGNEVGQGINTSERAIQ